MSKLQRFLALFACFAVGAALAPPADAHADRDDGERTTVRQGFFESFGSHTDRDIHGHAKLTVTDEKTLLIVDVEGLERGKHYPAHLHVGYCVEEGPHYRDDADGPGKPPNELWPSSDPDDPKAGLFVDDEIFDDDGSGRAHGKGEASWRARDDARSVMIHSPAKGHPVIACADLT